METFSYYIETRWYVVQTKPRNEERALFHLGRAGIETLNPKMESHTRRNAAKKILEPLFPGYIFARFAIAGHYPTVRWAKGVLRVLGTRKGPEPVSDEVIDQIQRRISGNGVVKRPYELKPEDSVKIRSGPLKDFVGIFDRWVSREGRIRVLVNLIGYETGVEIDSSHVERVWN